MKNLRACLASRFRRDFKEIFRQARKHRRSIIADITLGGADKA